MTKEFHPTTTTIDNVAIDIANYYAEPDFDPTYKQNLAKQMHEQRVRAWFLEELFFAYNNGYAHGKADASDHAGDQSGAAYNEGYEAGKAETSPGPRVIGGWDGLDDLPSGSIVVDSDDDIGVKQSRNSWHVRQHDVCVGNIWFSTPITVLREGGRDA